MNRRLYRIDTGYAVFGLESDTKGKVWRAAPIAKWTEGMDVAGIVKYYENKKGAKVTFEDTELTPLLRVSGSGGREFKYVDNAAELNKRIVRW